MALDKVSYWINIADYDLGTAEDLYTSKRWLYVAFMCHQVIEKTLKAYWNAVRDDDPPLSTICLTWPFAVACMNKCQRRSKSS